MISGRRKCDSQVIISQSREERIADIRGTIKINAVLIHAAQDLLNPDSLCSFQVYLKRIDEKAEVLKAERRSLIATYDKATNGEIPSLQQQQIELQVKLKQVQGNTKAKMENEARRMNKKVTKAEWLGKRIKDLEQQLRDEDFDVDELLKQAADL